MFLLSRIIKLTLYVLCCHFSAVICVQLAVRHLADKDVIVAAAGGAITCWSLLTWAFYKSDGFKDEE